MGQCQSSSSSQTTPLIPYQVDAEKDLGLQLFVVSDSMAYNRGWLGTNTKSLHGIQGITNTQDYYPSLKSKRKSSNNDDTTCRLSNLCLAAKGSPRGVTAKLLITTKAPRLTNVGPPTFDIIFQDQTKIRVGYHPMPNINRNNNTSPITRNTAHVEEIGNNSWMVTSLHFNDDPRPKYRIQMTRTNFPFLVQLFDGKTNATVVSMLTYGPSNNSPRIIHAFQGNIDTPTKAKHNYFGSLFGILNEENGILGFQDALRNDFEKATFCIMFLMRTRLLTFNGEW